MESTKKEYVNPEMELIYFDTEDVITTSGEFEIGGGEDEIDLD